MNAKKDWIAAGSIYPPVITEADGTSGDFKQFIINSLNKKSLGNCHSPVALPTLGWLYNILVGA